MDEKSEWIFPSPSVLTPPPLVCTWAGLRLVAVLLEAVAGGIEATMTGGMTGITTGGGAHLHTEGGAPHRITGGEISGAAAGASLPEEGITPQGDTRGEI